MLGKRAVSHEENMHGKCAVSHKHESMLGKCAVSHELKKICAAKSAVSHKHESMRGKKSSITLT